MISTIGNESEVTKEAEKVYRSLTANGIEVLYDDRDIRPGEKFADADLLGIPLRVVISEKNIKNGELEIKKRSEKTSHYIKMDELNKLIEKMQKDNT